MHSVSGFSSGGSLAVNHMFAYGTSVTGVGVLGGSPYGCGALPDASYVCSGMNDDGKTENRSIPWEQYVERCNAYAHNRAASDDIDPLTTLAAKRAYLFSGTLDDVVFTPVMQALAAQLGAFGAVVKRRFDVPAEHAWVVDSETCNRPGVAVPHACCGNKSKEDKWPPDCPLPPAYEPLAGGCCGLCGAGAPGSGWWWPDLVYCGGVDLSGEMLRFMLPHRRWLKAPVTAANLVRLNQSGLLPAGWSAERALLDSAGFMYVPQRCRTAAGACLVHVHYHPCDGSWRKNSAAYMLQSGLAAYAEGSGMVILHPQAQMDGPLNGCWDWYGATGADYDTRRGVQLRMVMTMIERWREFL